MRTLALPVLVVSVLFTLPARLQASGLPEPRPVAPTSILLSLPPGGFNVFKTMELEAAREAARAHASLEIAPRAATAVQQMDVIGDPGARGIGALILDPIDESACDALLARCQAGVTPVVSLDRLARGGKVALHVTCDSRAVGRLQATFLARVLGGRGTVGILGGPAGNSVSQAIGAGCMDVLRPLPAMKVLHRIGTGWTRDQARLIVGGWKSRGTVPDGILAANDALALGALDALGDTACLVVGADADPEALASLEAGKLAATVDKSPGLMAREALRAALHLAAHTPLSSADLTGTVAIEASQPTLYVPCRLIPGASFSRAAAP